MGENKPKYFACYRNVWKYYFLEGFLEVSSLSGCITRNPTMIAWNARWALENIKVETFNLEFCYTAAFDN